ncbi:iron-sulfur cluster biosynthesis family protein [Gracilibacillus sp. HCP3S3_G5_1]|uniref:iron-sulfur cluster biosynthesis family protein n=1 Tax=unclassified Gracilibacillus TaxID=2625209 RepID=UPI003F89E88D
MKLHLTKAAELKLHEVKLQDDHLPRIDAIMKGGCGLAIDFLFIFDTPRKNDSIYHTSGIAIQVDAFTKRYLADGTVTIDYKNDFQVISDSGFDSNC